MSGEAGWLDDLTTAQVIEQGTLSQRASSWREVQQVRTELARRQAAVEKLAVDVLTSGMDPRDIRLILEGLSLLDGVLQ